MTKRVLAFTFILAFLPFAANAASKNSANVVITNNVTVGTTELPKGTYKVVWTGTDTNAQVTFTQRQHGPKPFRHVSSKDETISKLR